MTVLTEKLKKASVLALNYDNNFMIIINLERNTLFSILFGRFNFSNFNH